MPPPQKCLFSNFRLDNKCCSRCGCFTIIFRLDGLLPTFLRLLADQTNKAAICADTRFPWGEDTIWRTRWVVSGWLHRRVIISNRLVKRLWRTDVPMRRRHNNYINMGRFYLNGISIHQIGQRERESEREHQWWWRRCVGGIRVGWKLSSTRNWCRGPYVSTMESDRRNHFSLFTVFVYLGNCEMHLSLFHSNYPIQLALIYEPWIVILITVKIGLYVF